MKVEMTYSINVTIGNVTYVVCNHPDKPKRQAMIVNFSAKETIATITKAQAGVIFQVPETIVDYLSAAEEKV